ncbi:Fe-S oxidoreductase [Haematococcus lacustris]
MTMRMTHQLKLAQASVPSSICIRPVRVYSVAGQRTSLVEETLQDMDKDAEFQQHLADLAARGQLELSREERKRRQRSLERINTPSFYSVCQANGVPPLVRGSARTLQLNIGLYCNQACTHCHVESSPKRMEMMDRATADQCLVLLREAVPLGLHTLDITGGAPELNSQFRYLVEQARAAGVPEIIDRCNLTVLLEPGQEELPAFLAQYRVRVVASLPCYSEKNVDNQRGSGVFERSIAGLQLLNKQGYGQPGSGLVLDLVYNPSGPFLAPAQAKLEESYRTELREAFGIEFSHLIALNNMPIKRYADWLMRRGKLDEYMQLLVDNFSPASAGAGLMCRDTVNVGWDGAVFDCDFNQQLQLSVQPPPGWAPGQVAAHTAAGSDAVTAEGSVPATEAAPSTWLRKSGVTVHQLRSLSELKDWRIACDNHCFGCTAGSGSSCGGQATVTTQKLASV